MAVGLAEVIGVGVPDAEGMVRIQPQGIAPGHEVEHRLRGRRGFRRGLAPEPPRAQEQGQAEGVIKTWNSGHEPSTNRQAGWEN